MKVIVESPFRNDVDSIRSENLIYLNCVARILALRYGYNPLFFHSFYTQFLDDDNSDQRDLGLNLSFEHHIDSEKRIVAIDRGITTGMAIGTKFGIGKGMDFSIFTVCPAGTDTAKEVDRINSIQDPIKRLEEAERVFSINMPKLNDFGDITPYRSEINEVRREVLEIINRFFSPLSQYVQSELIAE